MSRIVVHRIERPLYPQGGAEPRRRESVLPVVFVTHPTCPACGSIEHRVYRTTQIDEAVKRHVACKRCRTKFLTVSEPADVDGGREKK